MDIAIITPNYPPTHRGGGEISVQLLSEQLCKEDGCEVSVYSFDGDRKQTINGVNVHRLGNIPQYPYTLSNKIAHRKLNAEGVNCDMLHAYNMHLHPTVGRLSTEFDLPSVGTLNAYPLFDWAQIGVNPSLQRRLYERTLLRLERPRLKRMMQSIDVFLPLSSAVKRVYQERGFQGSSFKIIPNMIDPSFSFPDPGKSLSEKAKLLYVGYLRNSKGVRFLIDAMQWLSNEYTLKIVGDGPQRASLQKRVQNVNLSDRITFSGEVSYKEVTRQYVNTDVFVHPGVWPEPFGRTILEAMQAGLPVVATDVGGPGETVPQPELLCPPRDPKKLADSIKYAYEHRDQIGAENERIVHEKYHPDVVVPQFLETYREVIEES